jgi:hypothetical protein
VDFAHRDIVTALALLQRPADDVGRVVLQHWDRLTDPSTPASELAALVGVPTPAASASSVSAGGAACP